ncbi:MULTISPECIES: SusC/RagA family TonB-linked outer membrane protein [Butyricimonas]|uniref:SusC/RagA family TonB-linked outer membrane protein n=1 Tax=Butyricimonas TaxID=574697 RepID=UPI0018A88B41|nr:MULTISPECIES: SusC/RagA family TonB-linked outer membrane protein [Butyricimonas]
MKLFFLLTCCFTLSLSANSLAQQERVSLKMKNVGVEKLFDEVQRQTKLYFLFNIEQVKQLGKISLDVNNETVESVLMSVFKNSDLTYVFNGNMIVVRPRDTQENKEIKKIVITGKVSDEKKQPLPGVTVQMKGVAIGTATDHDGKYSLTIPNAPKKFTLVYSFVGMVTQEVIYAGKDTINVVMKEDVATLEDVVVTGYMNIRNSSFTGNAVTVKKEDLLKVSKTNVIKALQAFDPSFRIKENNRWGSDPNALPEVYIRGESGLGVRQLDADALSKSNLKDNPNLPTFIMDGFEVSVSKLYDMDPNRIESITILKDATATALYGSRAANGVVVITTVPPKAGKLNIDYSFVGDITFPDLSDYHLLDAKGKLETERLAGCYDLAVADDGYTDQYTLDKEYNEKLANVTKGVDTYWLSKPLQTVFNHTHSLYVDGGNESVRFGIELQYANQDGVMKGSLRDRMGAGVSLSYNYKTFLVKNTVTYQRVRTKESPFGNFADFAKQLPYDTYKDENGVYYPTMKSWGRGSESNRVNPMYEPSLHNFDKGASEEFINNLSINWNIIDGLLLKGQLSLTKTMNHSKRFYDPLSKQRANLNQLTLDDKNSSNNLSLGTLYLNNDDSFSLDMNATLSYNKALNGHMINALAGVSVKEDKSKANNATYIGFPSGTLSSPQYAKEMLQKTGFSESTKRLVGFLLSVNYSYQDIYLLDASVRFDGSSTFGSDQRFAPFWSFGLGVNLHKYDFIQSLGFVNQLKVRASYGQIGKANFPAYAARSTYDIVTDEWYKTGISTRLKALGNKNLTWETTNTFDIGAELSLFNDLLYVKGAYYDKRTIDLVNDVTVPTSTGFSSYRDNVGEISNKGYEFDVRVAACQTKDWSVIFNFNLAHNKNRIEKISESLRAYNERVQKMFEENLMYR